MIFLRCGAARTHRGAQKNRRAFSRIGSPQDGKENRRLSDQKSLAELLVIIAGVVIGLAADRWIKNVDQRAEESQYIASILGNLRADSTLLEKRLLRTDSASDQTMDLLVFVEDGKLPPGVDTTVFIRRVTTLSYFTPVDFARETWEDLVSTGKIEAISNDSIRRLLSHYYNGIDRLAALEGDWDSQLAVFERASWKTQSPMGRLAMLDNGGVPEEMKSRYSASKALSDVRTSIRSDPDLHASLAQARYVRNVSRKFYAGYLAELCKIMQAVRSEQERRAT